MRLRVNGELREVDGVDVVAGLLEALAVAPDGVAVAVNGEVVPRGRRGEHPVREGDVVEVIRAVGGG